MKLINIGFGNMINAQRLGESIVSDARVKADNLIREATIKKNDIISSAYNEIEGTEETLRLLKKEVSDFKRNILSLYKSHIESLSNLPEEKAEEPAPVQEPTESVVEVVTEEPVQDTVFVEENEVPVMEEKFKSVSSLFDEE